MRWSDGEPFNADDILFWYTDVLQNKELTAAIDARWQPGGELMTLVKVDDYTLRLTFKAPYYGMANWLASEDMTQGWWYVPEHYARKFHKKYNADVDKLAKDAGFDTWVQLYNNKVVFRIGAQRNPDVPLLNPWVLKELSPQRAVWERNPYFWKVDTSGNQLPYIDRILATIVTDGNLKDAKILSGDLDFAVTGTLNLYQQLKAAEAKNSTDTWLLKNLTSGSIAIGFNQLDKDEKVRAILKDVRFRQALSVAIDREDINKTVFFGLAKARQAGAYTDSVFYEKEMGEYFAKYDVAQANTLLDQVGLKKGQMACARCLTAPRLS
jgi:peptide/nickel transport system substrate-binding protein